MSDWIAIISRHLTTVLVIVALMWTIAKPHAEEFVKKTVNERITKIEVQLDEQEDLLRDIIKRLDIIDNRMKR